MARSKRLFNKVSLWKRGTGSDGAGGKNSAFIKQFDRRAEYSAMRGSETVVANRLEGRHTQIASLRADPQTKLITTGWMLKDEGSKITYNIRDVSPADDRLFLDLLCESGVAP